jgi:hypothetical protein
MGIVGTHPAVFARVANKEVAGYGTWKSVRKTGGRDRRTGPGLRKGIWFEGRAPPFFVSVASKGLSLAVSLLFATLAGRFISVAPKGLKAIVGSDPSGVGAGEVES